MKQSEKKVWDDIWKEDIKPFDSLSYLILHHLKKTVNSNFIELGAGSGRISAELQKLKGVNAYFLDISNESLNYIKTQGARRLICGDVLKPPLKKESFSYCWNAGVIEHFKPTAQKEFFKETARILKNDGKAVIFTPYNKNFLFVFFKKIFEKINIWPYGREIPIETVKDLLPHELELQEEYSICFFSIFIGGLKIIFKGKLSFVYNFIDSAYLFLLKSAIGKYIIKTDKFLSRIFGGYLIVSVIKKKDKEERI